MKDLHVAGCMEHSRMEKRGRCSPQYSAKISKKDIEHGQKCHSLKNNSGLFFFFSSVRLKQGLCSGLVLRFWHRNAA